MIGLLESIPTDDRRSKYMFIGEELIFTAPIHACMHNDYDDEHNDYDDDDIYGYGDEENECL